MRHLLLAIAAVAVTAVGWWWYVAAHKPSSEVASAPKPTCNMPELEAAYVGEPSVVTWSSENADFANPNPPEYLDTSLSQPAAGSTSVTFKDGVGWRFGLFFYGKGGVTKCSITVQPDYSIELHVPGYVYLGPGVSVQTGDKAITVLANDYSEIIVTRDGKAESIRYANGVQRMNGLKVRFCDSGLISSYEPGGISFTISDESQEPPQCENHMG